MFQLYFKACEVTCLIAGHVTCLHSDDTAVTQSEHIKLCHLINWDVTSQVPATQFWHHSLWCNKVLNVIWHVTQNTMKLGPNDKPTNGIPCQFIQIVLQIFLSLQNGNLETLLKMYLYCVIFPNKKMFWKSKWTASDSWCKKGVAVAVL